MSDDTISRDAAIDAIFKTCRRTCTLSHELEKAFERLPSAQPHDIARDIATIIENEKDMRVMLKNAQPDVPDTNGGDIIYRRAAIDALIERDPNCGIDSAEVIKDLPSAQPEADEWCTDCKEYDHDKHCCPRWNRVIKTALEDAQPEPLTLRVNSELTKEEYDKLMQDIKDAPIVLLPSAKPEQRWIPCSERLPEETKDVLVCYDFKGNRSVLIGALYDDGKFYGYEDEYLTPEGRKYRKAVAWMPLPEPYKGEQE